MKVFVCVRLTPFCDKHLYYNFFNYYKSIGVEMCLVNFNSKVDSPKEIEDFVEDVLHEFKDFIIYNIGPNGIEFTEGVNVDSLKTLVRENVKNEDYILPTDCDEFHYIPINLKKLELYDFDYINGPSLERISYNFKLENVDKNISLFENFPFWRGDTIIPKISLCKKDIYLNHIQVGAHNLSNLKDNNFIKYPVPSIVNHFRWSLEGLEKRIEVWNKIWNSDNYKGWKPKSISSEIEKRKSEYLNIGNLNDIYLMDNTDSKNFNFNKLDFLKYELYNNQTIKKNDDKFLLKLVDKSYIEALSKKLYMNFDEFVNYKYIDTKVIYCYEDIDNLVFINSIDIYFKRFN